MIEPHKAITPFDFGEAVTMAFRTSGGKQFGWRLLFWVSIIMGITYLITIPMIMPHYGELLSINQQNIQSIGTGDAPDNDALLSLFKRMALPYFLMMAGIWLAWVMGETALYRKALRDEEAPRQPLRLGQDEFRVLLSQLGVFGLIAVVYIFGLIGVVAISAILGSASAILGGLLAFIGVIAVICWLVNLSVKLAPAAALSVANRQPHVLAARKVTKYRFWNLFAAYLVVFIGGYIGLYLIMYLGIILVTGNGDFFIAMTGLGAEDPQVIMEAAAQRLKNPLVMILSVLAQIAYAAAFSLWMLCLTGIGAYAVRWWKADNPLPKFD